MANRRSGSLFSRMRPTTRRERQRDWSIEETEPEPEEAQERSASPFDALSHGDLLASVERELGRLRLENRELRAEVANHATALEMLRVGEEKYRAVFLDAPIALLELDVLGTVTLCSRATHELLACTDEDLLGKPLWRMAETEPARDALRDLLTHRGKRLRHGPLAFELRRGDGSTLGVELFAGPKTDEHGRAVGSIISMTDASARARREAELNATANAYRDLFDSAPVMLLAVDAKTTTILECNSAVAAATGYARDELLDRSIFDLYDPTSLDAAAEAFRNFLRGGETVDVTLRVRHKRGTTFTVLETASAVADEGGAILACRLVWRPTEALTRRAVASKRHAAIVETRQDGVDERRREETTAPPLGKVARRKR
jgi:PAS domain S-box-containing protein